MLRHSLFRAAASLLTAAAVLPQIANAAVVTSPVGAPISVAVTGAASPYPSTVTVTQARGVIKSVRLVMTGLTAGYPSDWQITLAKNNATALDHLFPSNGVITLHQPVIRFGFDGAIATGTYNMSFSDTGTVWNTLTPLPAGDIKSANSMNAAFAGQSLAGDYSLGIFDSYSSTLNGVPDEVASTIASWYLEFTTIADLYFNANGAPGTWVEGSNLWRGDSLAGDPIAWDSTLNFTAHFDGAPGTVTVDGAGVSAYALQFDVSGYTLTGGNITLTNGEINVVTGTAAISAPIDATANGLLKTGAGTLNLSGAVNAGTKSVTVSAGTLALVAGGAVTADSLVVTGGAFTLSGGTFTGTAGATLSGGQVNIDSGSLTLGADFNATAGAINYTGGTLNVPVLALSGTASLNATTALSLADLTVAGNATAVAGAGLTASGAVTVGGGSLDVTGTLTAATLNFTGGTIRADQFAVATTNFTGGSFSPAGAGTIGAVNFTGTLNLSGTNIYQVDVTSTAVHDTTSAAQTNINGGTLLVNLTTGSTIQLGQSFTLFTGPVAGTGFTQIQTTNAYPFISLQQVPNTGDFVANADFANAAIRIGGGSTLAAVGGALQRVYEAGGPPQAGLSQLANSVTSTQQASVALNAFVPNNGLALTNTARTTSTSIAASYSSFTSRVHAGDFNTSNFSSTPLFNSYSFDYAGKKPVLVASADDSAIPLFSSETENFSVWLNGNGGFRKIKSDPSANLVKSRDNYYGGAVGFDYRATSRYEDDIHVGIFAAAQSGESKTGEDGFKSDSDSTSYAPGLYISGVTSNFEIDLMASYAITDYKLSRDIPAAGLTPASVATADTDGSQAMVRAAIARPWHFDNGVFFTPTGSLAYTHGEVDGYTESGSALASLVVGDQDFDSLESNIGFTLGKQFDFDTLSISPSFSLGWGHEFLDRSGQVAVSSATLGGAFNYTADTPELGADFLTVGVNLALYTSAHTRIMIGYDGRFLRAGVDADHRASATFRIDF